ncbi:MAG: hypothetical protein LQ343_006406 [Gyalolechia ehrenbergii]|nr:MAG: hypothetical protein LQ343_006406 [Gyalolechia ehrenbergii]
MDESNISGTQALDLSTNETSVLSDPASSDDRGDGTELAEDLLKGCHELLNELQTFQKYLEEQKREHTVEVKPFRNSITAELKSLERLRTADPELDRTVHTLRSSNLPFHRAVWDAAKTTTGLVAFTKRFYWDTSPMRSTKRTGQAKRRCALVDIVAQDGQQWIKVSTVTESRLLFELAKAGWEHSDSDGDDDGLLVNGLAHTTLRDAEPLDTQSLSRLQEEDDDDRVEIVRQAEDLQKASVVHKVHYKHPTITFILPKISRSPPPEILRILDSIRSTGATVLLGPPSMPLDLPSVFQNLVPDSFHDLTPTLNIDCTILLALVSDLSHSATTPEPWFNKAISRQVELEKREQLLPSTLWPAMAGRTLVCTEEAAVRMNEIVNTIGTASERRRSDLLLLAPGQEQHQSTEDLRTTFAELSNYTVPNDWNLPIKVVASGGDFLSQLPPAAKQVKESLTAINQSVFLYGWKTGWTTLTSNRTVVRQIEEIVEGAQGEQVGPKVWLCRTARSLVGKEKGRRDLKGLEKGQ